MVAITIGKLASETGVHLETVRYYERIGLIPAPRRARNGYRHYRAEDVRRLSFVRRARDLGFDIEEIRTLLALAEPGLPSCDEVRTLAIAHLGDIQSKISDLQRLASLLTTSIEQCRESEALTCPVLDMLGASAIGSTPNP
ncbi:MULTISPECIES: MerR family transcriptional regulator [Acetobacteraceae]|jgi:MerR family transcriptional regulator, mercuric resistance operon regulatory protein|uniref:Helix-turn-helix domain-containing protein n=9 Tax=Acetobacteraceae TaxID=433 RepID=A0A839V2D7_9PROT|nr:MULTISPECIES: helix-turn-helix domain-containing protein [Acetobacteraceae]GBO82424.1 transcriptional regulator [Acetobacter aceti NRIC 0242]ETC97447.1 MerR family transcriptional regulator [Asaia sp. SF2.1]KXV49215.1 transcriptional regulator [Gluconobacter albidus]MBB3173689.1 MerR family mercuric resistance operon transcriptional regulator [Endobacter medicaginis]MBU2652979.1 helix-turn-helix domain-containing protein [Acidomonas methanolica]